MEKEQKQIPHIKAGIPVIFFKIVESPAFCERAIERKSITNDETTDSTAINVA